MYHKARREQSFKRCSDAYGRSYLHSKTTRSTAERRPVDAVRLAALTNLARSRRLWVAPAVEDAQPHAIVASPGVTKGENQRRHRLVDFKYGLSPDRGLNIRAIADFDDDARREVTANANQTRVDGRKYGYSQYLRVRIVVRAPSAPRRDVKVRCYWFFGPLQTRTQTRGVRGVFFITRGTIPKKITDANISIIWCSPPCTFFSAANTRTTRSKKKKFLAESDEIVRACTTIIKHFEPLI